MPTSAGVSFHSRDELRHREGDRQDRVGVEEGGDAHDDAQEHQPGA